MPEAAGRPGRPASPRKNTPRKHKNTTENSFSCLRAFVVAFPRLEDEPERKLHHARVAGQARDRACRRVADVRVRQPELGLVEDVEHFPPQLERRLAAEG